MRKIKPSIFLAMIMSAIEISLGTVPALAFKQRWKCVNSLLLWLHKNIKLRERAYTFPATTVSNDEKHQSIHGRLLQTAKYHRSAWAYFLLVEIH